MMTKPALVAIAVLCLGVPMAGHAQSSNAPSQIGVTEITHPTIGQKIWLLPDGRWVPAGSAIPSAPMASPSSAPVSGNQGSGVQGTSSAQNTPAAQPALAQPAAHPGGNIPSNTPAPQVIVVDKGATQGGLFGTRTILPTDKDFNRGSMNPKMR